jgi:excisionase family DNA binding protein
MACYRMDEVADTLKGPNQTMAGSWVGLHDRPVRPAVSRVAASLVAGAGPRCRDRTNAAPLRARHRNRSAERKGCAVAAQPSGKAAPDLPRYLHTAEVADILQVSPKTVSRWAKEGKLPFLKTLGGHRRYPAAEIRQLADELQVQPTA